MQIFFMAFFSGLTGSCYGGPKCGGRVFGRPCRTVTSMSLSFAIIGGGWYGCHIALSFRALGFNVTVFEQHHRLLHLASGNNQFRLHLGFHYPRHYLTRRQSRDGFSRFVERYPALSRPVGKNIYAVPRGESLIDFLTYKLIMTSSGIEFVELTSTPPILANVEGCLAVPERVLLLDRARRFFSERLGPFFVPEHRVESVVNGNDFDQVDGRRFDFVIDATWGHFGKPPIDLYYEPTILLYYEAELEFPAVTFVDGPLCAIYPTEDPKLYTLSSVPHTPLGRFDTAAAARNALDSINRDIVARKMLLMEEQISHFVPGFHDVFRFVAPQISIKTKPAGNFDDRSCYVFKTGRVFSVMSGKIDTIFFAVDRILSLIEAMPEEPLRQEPGTLREQIMGSSAHLAPARADDG
jgi:hypothetical protein